jgi:hypothetical protein
MFCGRTYKNWETAERRIRRYDLFSLTVRIKKAMRKRTFFCFSVASGNLHEGLRTLYCCRRHKFWLKSIVVHHSVFLHRSIWHVAQQYTQKSLLCFHWHNGKANESLRYVIRELPILFVIISTARTRIWYFVFLHCPFSVPTRSAYFHVVHVFTFEITNSSSQFT